MKLGTDDVINLGGALEGGDALDTFAGTTGAAGTDGTAGTVEIEGEPVGFDDVSNSSDSVLLALI